jgi:cytochrome c5
MPVASLQRGRHLAGAVVGCTACHGATLGGAPFIDDPATVVLWAPNLTRGRGGFLAAHGAAAFERALRHGIGPDGKKLMVMPSWDYAALSSADFASILAYVRSVPPVDRRTPPVKLGPKGGAAIRSGELSYDADLLAKEPVPQLDSTPSDGAAYGGYLARVAGCESCHGEHLAGTPGGAPPHAPNLGPRALGTWTAATFVTAIRTGRVPGGRKLDPEAMPWPYYAHMTDGELHALYAYLQTLRPRAKGT